MQEDSPSIVRRAAPTDERTADLPVAGVEGSAPRASIRKGAGEEPETGSLENGDMI